MIIESIKEGIYNAIGRKSYLRLLQKSMNFSIQYGLLKKNPIYKYHYFVDKLIKPGFTVIDLGANLGYYTKIFSDLVGPSGMVYAVEPVFPFYETLLWGLSDRENIKVYNFALGLEEKNIQMTIPTHMGHFRTGLPQVSDISEFKDREDLLVFDAEMRIASKLFQDLVAIDYIKIDIEGYEEFVIPDLMNLIIKHQSIVQIETWGKHKRNTFNALLSGGLKPYVLNDNLLYEVTEDKEYGMDYIFIPHSKIELYSKLISKK